MTPDQLEQIKRRAEAATKGDGAWFSGRRDMQTFVESTDGELVEVVYVYRGSGPQERIPIMRDNPRADADFIAAARQDIPVLVAEVERLRAEVERLHDVVEFYKDE